MSDALALPAASPPAAPPIAPATPAQTIPWLGLAAVLLGTFISTLNGRLSTFGLADIRGAMHAGFDEGAWITTAQTVAQMLVAPLAIWVGTIYGPRRVLLGAALAFAVISAIEPLSTNLPMLLGLQFMSGLTSGCFVPLTLAFILRNVPPKYLGVTAYPRQDNTPRPDLYGLATSGLGLALIYAGLDQGNRLDWMNSGLIWGLMLSGALLLIGFFVHEGRTKNPLINLKVAFAPPLPRLLVLIGFLRLTILSTAYLIPQYLGAVRGFRALEVGQTLWWIAAPQLIFCPLAALMLRRTDPRLVSSIGFIFVAVACLMVAHGLTPLCSSDQFLPSQLLQAIGQSFALSGILFFAVLHLRPEHALTFGAAVQTARLMGGQIGQAFIVTLTRVRSQHASNLIGLHIHAGDGAVMQRLQAYTQAAGRTGADPATAAGRAATLLGGIVRSAASTQGVIDGFIAIGALTAFALLIVVAHKPAPIGPASHLPLFSRPPQAPA